jgi:hypothetical protein
MYVRDLQMEVVYLHFYKENIEIFLHLIQQVKPNEN